MENDQDMAYPLYLRGPSDQISGMGSNDGRMAMGNVVGPSLPVGPVNVTPYVRDSFRMQPTEFAPKGMYSVSPGVALSADLPAGGGTLRLGGQVDRTMTNLPTQSNRTNWGGGAEYQHKFDTSRIVDAIMRKFK